MTDREQTRRDAQTRGDRYGDLPRALAEWWNNVGRYEYPAVAGSPALTETSEALFCTACHDVGEIEAADSPSGRCEACGRRL